MRVGVVFGGMSTEKDISVMSAKSVLNHLDKNKYEIFPIFIDSDGNWYEYDGMKKIVTVVEFLKSMDVIFPVLHGLYGEDGTIQGMFEMLKIPYVGCRVLASSVGMDKVYTKNIFEKAKINQAKYVYIKKYEGYDKYIYIDDEYNEKDVNLEDIHHIVEEKINYPVFIKPSNSGSSVGVNKAENYEQLVKAIEEAAKFDSKILIEEGIIGKEVECAVIGNSKLGVEASRVGQILSAEDFYTFDAKYENPESKTVIPADITEEQQEEIRKLAIKAFKAIDGSGLSRVDFFVEEKTGKVLINEINTMPGFTNISMYPKLMEDYKYGYSELLDKLIEIALN